MTYGREGMSNSRVPSFLPTRDRKSTRLNSSHGYSSYAVFCLKKKNKKRDQLEAGKHSLSRRFCAAPSSAQLAPNKSCFDKNDYRIQPSHVCSIQDQQLSPRR